MYNIANLIKLNTLNMHNLLHDSYTSLLKKCVSIKMNEGNDDIYGLRLGEQSRWPQMSEARNQLALHP